MEESTSPVVFRRYQSESDSGDGSNSKTSDDNDSRDKKREKKKNKRKHDSKKKSKKKKEGGKDKKKKHKHKHKHKVKHRRKDEGNGDLASKNNVIQASIEARKGTGLDWMCLPPPAVPSATQNGQTRGLDPEQLRQQALEQRIQDEVNSGKRESSSKLPYGLFDPKRQKLNDELPSKPRDPTQVEETDQFGRVKPPPGPDLEPRRQPHPLKPSKENPGQPSSPLAKKMSVAEEMRLLVEGTTSTADLSPEALVNAGSAKGSDSSSVTTAKLNKLVAQGMRAQLMGDSEKYTRIQEKIAALKSSIEQSGNSDKTETTAEGVTVIAPFDERGRVLESLVEGYTPATLEREDVRSRRKRGILFHESRVDSEGNVNAVLATDLKEKDSSVKDMLAREKMSRRDKLDEAYMRNIMKQGSRFKDSSLQRQIGRENEDIDITLYESKQDKMTAKRLEELERKRAVAAHRKLTKAELSCPFSFRNPNFRKDLVVTVGEYVYVMLPVSSSSIADGHCRIIPIESIPAFTSAGDEVWEEANRFKRILEAKAAAEDKTMVYMETVMDTNRLGWHTSIECIPVDENTAEIVPMYFKKGLLEADAEWSTHRKVIDTSTKGLRRSIPPDFPYFHVEWAGGGYKPGGYAHVVENPAKFPQVFGIDTLCGAMGRDPSRFNRRGKSKSTFDHKNQLDLFKQAWHAAKSKQN